MDLNVFKGMGMKVFATASISMALPFFVTVLTSRTFGLKSPTFDNHTILFDQMNKGVLEIITFTLFLALSVSVTASPLLARLMAEFKILSTDIGQLAMSAAIANEMIGWVLFTLSVAMADIEREDKQYSWYWVLSVLLSAVLFVVACFLLVQPAMSWVTRRVPEGQPISNTYLGSVLISATAAALVADMLGIHAAFGAFFFGLMIPTGPVAVAIIDRTEDFVVSFLLPIFFIHAGLRTNLTTLWMEQPATEMLKDSNKNQNVAIVLTIAAACKVLSGVLVAVFFSMPILEGLTLGILLSTKGPLEMIIAILALHMNIFSQRMYAMIIVGIVVVMIVASPLAQLTHQPYRPRVAYKRRNIQRMKHEGELRMVACVHTYRNVPSIISLLHISNPTRRSPISVYALHLIELSGRASAMLVVHNPGSKRAALRRKGGPQQNEQIMSAFENYELHASGISVQPHTAVSLYSSMHQDICNIAEDRHATLIVLPFHKVQTLSGDMETVNPSIRVVNQKVFAEAPCSVAILIDRGLRGGSRFTATRNGKHNIAVLFFGGPDDREALAYAWRMAEHPSVSLMVVRFIQGDNVAAASFPEWGQSESSSSTMAINTAEDDSLEWQLDDEFVNEFRLKIIDKESVVYTEKVANNSEETVAEIRTMEACHDVYIVGRGHKKKTPLTAGLAEWSEYPELGAIGDLLASDDFGVKASVLVVQQHVADQVGGDSAEVASRKESSRKSVLHYLNKADHRTQIRSFFNTGWNG
ncbi:cation/H(+) antiporter 15-like [Typha latifolia]|uniref:cation/H(+) antiporter 15-like n=1 Tax=Typha latifolia TaxID=4733 RepID=UPI003C2CA663